jgi:hypothetical protein
MERQHRRMTEGNLYVFTLPPGTDKASLTEGIDQGLVSAKCGQLLGSGMSIGSASTVAVEIGAYDRDKANNVISRVCRRMKCRDFEMAWD